jgi:2-(1,2-epoxy-1,2-dihydrophenyl)acetyl-CoA isomerase
MAYQTLLTEQDGYIRQITLNRADVLNALSVQLLDELQDTLRQAAEDKSVRTVILTGAGRGFCSGADLTQPSDLEDIQGTIERYYNPVVRLLSTMPKPVIAAVNGVAAGAGMSLALACDLRLLSSSAVFTVGFSGIGLVLDAGASHFLPRLVGHGRAIELALSNRKVDAEEALHIGLGTLVIPADTFMQEVWPFAQRLAEGPTQSYARIKQQLQAAATNDLETQLALEATLQAEAAATNDFQRAVRAFRSKQPVLFEGN